MYDKPGCFGNAVTYSDRSKTCAACDEKQECSVAALKRLEELKSLVSVDSITKMSHKGSQQVANTLPDTAQRLLATMTSRQRKAVGVLSRLDQPTPLMFVQDLLKCFDSWDKSEAIETAKFVVKELVQNGLADIEGGRILLRF